MSEAKPTWVLVLLLILVGILSVMVIGLIMAFGGTLGFLISITAGMLGSTVPEQIRVTSWGIAALGMTVFGGTTIIGFIVVLAGVLVTLLRSTRQGN